MHPRRSPEANAAPEQWQRDRSLYLQATTRPGAKIPHVWLVDRGGRRISTLDVVGHGRLSLVTGLSGTAWLGAAERLAQPSLRTVVIDTADAQDLYYSWARCREIAEAGALLVRPDGYVAWRHLDAVWDESIAFDTLRSALKAILATSSD